MELKPCTSSTSGPFLIQYAPFLSFALFIPMLPSSLSRFKILQPTSDHVRYQTHDEDPASEWSRHKPSCECFVLGQQIGASEHLQAVLSILAHDSRYCIVNLLNHHIRFSYSTFEGGIFRLSSSNQNLQCLIPKHRVLRVHPDPYSIVVLRNKDRTSPELSAAA